MRAYRVKVSLGQYRVPLSIHRSLRLIEQIEVMSLVKEPALRAVEIFRSLSVDHPAAEADQTSGYIVYWEDHPPTESVIASSVAPLAGKAAFEYLRGGETLLLEPANQHIPGVRSPAYFKTAAYIKRKGTPLKIFSRRLSAGSRQ